jgi:hypothetical protein
MTNTLADDLRLEDAALHRRFIAATAPKRPLSLDEARDLSERMTDTLDEDSLDREPVVCTKCGRPKRANCEDGWLPPIGPCSDDSYITSRPCPNA